MGTRARVEMFDGDACMVSIYTQFDGYPSGLGKKLAEFLDGFKIVNGISEDDKGKVANGMGCLAAQLVADMKEPKPGGVYLRKQMTEDGECGEEFIYRIQGGWDHDQNKPLSLSILVTEGSMTAFGNPNNPESFKGVFKGTVPEFSAWCEKAD